MGREGALAYAGWRWPPAHSGCSVKMLTVSKTPASEEDNLSFWMGTFPGDREYRAEASPQESWDQMGFEMERFCVWRGLAHLGLPSICS